MLHNLDNFHCPFLINVLMKALLPLLFLALLACQPEPEKASPLYYITASRNDTPNKLRENCVFRYNLETPFNRLADQAQQDAIKTAFDLWQSSNPNLRFLRYQGTNAELTIRFVPNTLLNNETLKAPIGLVRGEVATLSASKKENNAHVILLSNDYAWDSQSLTRVLTHQIGLFLGLNTSSETNSMMNPIFQKEAVRLSKSDSTIVNKLYPEACRNLVYSFLPLSFQVNKETPKKIILDKQGILAVKASGYLGIGIWLGGSYPDGLERGLFNFPIDGLSIVGGINHAALMYKLNNEANWHFCGSNCEIKTDGISQYLELTFHVNDLDLTDNSGAYNVTVNYK